MEDSCFGSIVYTYNPYFIIWINDNIFYHLNTEKFTIINNSTENILVTGYGIWEGNYTTQVITHESDILPLEMSMILMYQS